MKRPQRPEASWVQTTFVLGAFLLLPGCVATQGPATVMCLGPGDGPGRYALKMTYVETGGLRKAKAEMREGEGQAFLSAAKCVGREGKFSKEEVSDFLKAR